MPASQESFRKFANLNKLFCGNKILNDVWLHFNKKIRGVSPLPETSAHKTVWKEALQFMLNASPFCPATSEGPYSIELTQKKGWFPWSPKPITFSITATSLESPSAKMLLGNVEQRYVELIANQWDWHGIENNADMEKASELPQSFAYFLFERFCDILKYDLNARVVAKEYPHHCNHHRHYITKHNPGMFTTHFELDDHWVTVQVKPA
jgi:hypothetical protein